MLDKARILDKTKADMLDKELIEEMKKEVPDELPSIFISSVAQLGIGELKDMLWKELNK